MNTGRSTDSNKGRNSQQNSAQDSGRFRFGLFEFDIAPGELRREGVVVRLQSQPAQVLGCLLAQHGQVVTREQLCQAVWGSETFVDFERGLNFCIAQIRSALGDDSTTPRFVRTLPKRGYQFIAPVEPVSAGPQLPPGASRFGGLPVRTMVAACAVLLAVVAFYAGHRSRAEQGSRPRPIIAVVRFDNETGDAGMMRLSDGLTDSLVERLTAMGGERYGVIGNAQILRLPREQRDLTAIAASLHAGYVVLGQLQENNTGIRVLAHLIRMPDQTHLWVTRIDRAATDPLSTELETAQKIASDFSPRVMQDASGSRLPPFPNH